MIVLIHGENLQILQKQKLLDELDHWVTDMKNQDSIFNLSNYSYFENNLTKMKVIHSAKNNFSNFKFSDILKVKGFINKVEVLLILVLPKKILKIL